MKITNCIYSILIAVNFLKPSTTAAAVAVAALHEKVEGLEARTTLLATRGYTNEADILARQNTTQLLKPLTNRVATLAEAEVMIGVHLKAELYYAFNTQWGTGKVRNHRIIYDFLCQQNKAVAWNANQKEHLTVLTILSLAAQEYFWNEKSSHIDLRSCVRQEFRYGLFNQAGHKLNITSLAYLDDSNLNRLITKWVDDSLIGKLRMLMTGFRAKTLGSTYTAIIEDLTAKLASVATAKLDLDLRASTIATFRLATGADEKLDLKHVPSVGDGMCGEHSLFIPTDGGCQGIQEGNGRYKILRAIFDNANTPEARRFYLLASQHMDGPKFEALIGKQITALRPTSADQADALQAKLDAYREQNQKATAGIEDFVSTSKKTLVTTTVQLPGLVTALKTFNTALNTSAQLSALSSQVVFRNIIDELIKFRTVNAELNRLLCTIDADILRLNGEISAEKLAAEARLPQDKTTAHKAFSEVQADFEKFKTTNAALLTKAIGLIAAHKAINDRIATTPAPGVQAVKTALDAAAAEFGKLQTDNQQFFKDHGEKETLCNMFAMAANTVAVNYATRDAKLAEKYRLIGDTLKGFIGENMLPSASADAFTVDALSSRYGSFINDICQGLCVMTGDKATQATIRAHWDAFDGAKIAMEAQKERRSALRRVEIATSLLAVPAELTPTTLRQEMLALAEKVDYEGIPTELGGWLPCDALYTQLWAVLNNLTQCASFHETKKSKASGFSGFTILLNIKQTVCAKIFRPTFAHKCHKSLALIA